MNSNKMPGLTISIDIETTGLNPDKHKILQFSAIIYDFNKDHNVKSPLDLPHYSVFIDNGPSIYGQVYALNMNSWILDILSKPEENADRIVKANVLASNFQNFLLTNGFELNEYGKIKFVIAGKNVAGFDLPFLNKLPDWNRMFTIPQRVLDPAILYYNPTIDEIPPSLDDCLERASLEGEITHDALYDAWDVIRVLRKKLIN